MSLAQRTDPSSVWGILYAKRKKPDSFKVPPKKIATRQDRVQQAAASLDTPEERKARTKAAREAKVLRVNQYSDIARFTDSDKTRAIVGKRNSARSQ